MTFPRIPMERLLAEACASFSLRHPGEDPVDPASGEWALVYRIVVGHLRHAYSSYDQQLSAAGGDPTLRAKLRSEIEAGAARTYPWLRRERDPRAQESTPSRPPTLVLTGMSARLADLVTRRAQLVVAISEYRRKGKEQRTYIDTLKAQLREVEAEIREASGYFEASKGVTETGATLLYFGRPDGGYRYGREDLAESYTKSAGYKCPRCLATVMRTKRPLDHGCGIKLNAYSCLCVSISVAAEYSIRPHAWGELLTRRPGDS
jgi:hypothetical protein